MSDEPNDTQDDDDEQEYDFKRHRVALPMAAMKFALAWKIERLRSGESTTEEDLSLDGQVVNVVKLQHEHEQRTSYH